MIESAPPDSQDFRRTCEYGEQWGNLSSRKQGNNLCHMVLCAKNCAKAPLTVLSHLNTFTTVLLGQVYYDTHSINLKTWCQYLH